MIYWKSQKTFVKKDYFLNWLKKGSKLVKRHGFNPSQHERNFLHRVSSWEKKTRLRRKRVKLSRNYQFPLYSKDQHCLQWSWDKRSKLGQIKTEWRRRKACHSPIGVGKGENWFKKIIHPNPNPTSNSRWHPWQITASQIQAFVSCVIFFCSQ